MRLNSVETALMNNPVRAAIQSRFEAERLLAMGGACGAGGRWRSAAGVASGSS